MSSGISPSPKRTPGVNCFAAVPFEDKGGFFQLRYNQDVAIERVPEAIGEGKEKIPAALDA